MPERDQQDVIDVNELMTALMAMKKGDLTHRMPYNLTGIAGKVADTFNEVMDMQEGLVREITSVAHIVGKEGKLEKRFDYQSASGSWKEAVESLNELVEDLIQPTNEMVRVINAVAEGDLSQKVDLEIDGRLLTGNFQKTATNINKMVHQLSIFASEVTRVSLEVGTEGILGGQADVKGVSGTWKNLTDSVNNMANNLTNQVRNIAAVTTAVAKGDLTKQITVDAKGEILELKNTVNTMVEQLSTFASEVTRVSLEVGTEGMLGGQADVKGVSGTWKNLTDSVNNMANNLTNQVRNIAAVTTAVANGDLTKQITVDAKGEILELKNTVNTMVEQLSTFASEVTRVAREVGTEGRLGGQADVKGVSGTWRDLTESVNDMASNLTDQVRNIAVVTTAVANGDLSKQITVNAKGEILEMKNTINTMVGQLLTFASEVTRVAREVGTLGMLGGQAQVKGVAGTWRDLTESVNDMASNLTNQVRNIAVVTTAVANGDLSKKITVDVKGELLELKNTVNTMVDQLSSFASEVTRVASEVGTEGKLGGQAQVRGVGGIWNDLTDNVNLMATNLTDQVRGIAKVVTAVANGNLEQKLNVEAKGEVAELRDTINNMINTLATFADQVTTVAREVGAEGKLGGQANVPGAAGTWRDLTDNVNYMASTLTTQVREITNVVTAVTKGDLSRTIDVAAAGEVAALKDNVNEMIRNLIETTRINMEQDWLKTNLAKFSRMLQGQRDLLAVSRMILSELAPLVSMQHGVLYIAKWKGGEQVLSLFASYAYQQRKHLSSEFRAGEGLVGQCLLEKQRILLTHVPNDYVMISSGLGEATPLNIVLLPILFEGQVLAVMELASFRKFSDIDIAFLDQLTETIGSVMNSMQANQRTEQLLAQSQSLTEELQNQQEELQNKNEELEEKAKLLVIQKAEVEIKNNEVEIAKQIVEEKAEQLALTSRYKSEFLANMSHELRTPLNSLLLLAEQLADNPDRNLTAHQVKYAETIQDAGTELLNLINDILDLSKIESGTVSADFSEVMVSELLGSMNRTFRHMVDGNRLQFNIIQDHDTPQYLLTDSKRIQQILKNLLSNAFKFTEQGEVKLHVHMAKQGWSPYQELLTGANSVVCFTVSDTGIGIPADKQQIIFEAFQQADGSTNREYGGTGLGLAISKEIAALLGGEITLESQVGKGSKFHLYLPADMPQSELETSSKYEPEVIDITPRETSRPLGLKSHFAEVADDRDQINPDDQVLLIIEDDWKFNQILKSILNKKGIKVIFTSHGAEALSLAVKYHPAAITLDLRLEDMDGMLVIDQLKNELKVRHIPICVITVEEDAVTARQKGVYDYVCKPVSGEELENTLDRLIAYSHNPKPRLLMIESDTKESHDVERLLSGDFGIVERADNAAEAMKQLAEDAEAFECVLTGASLPDQEVLRLVREMSKLPKHKNLPILVQRTSKWTPEQELELEELSKTVVLKQVKSLNRIVDEVSLFLHYRFEELPEETQELLVQLHQSDEMIKYKKVLVVDDDIRNIFALMTILERHNMKVIPAENGREAIRILEETPDIEIVLMDIMMPVMDGYETTRLIRQDDRFKELPIIALTAKAMKGDREACLDAGASDYITKPVNSTQLLTMIRSWLGIAESTGEKAGENKTEQ